jgi:hypothetical protein
MRRNVARASKNPIVAAESPREAMDAAKNGK